MYLLFFFTALVHFSEIEYLLIQNWIISSIDKKIYLKVPLTRGIQGVAKLKLDFFNPP